MTELLRRFDAWLDDAGPAALVLREHLDPVEGPDGVVFPATYAASEDKSFPGGYNIDTFPDGKNVCLIDSVGSQANRLEPLFMKDGYAGLVPQIVVKAGEHRVNLLAAGHRAGDAIVRCSSLQEELRDAFLAVLRGDAAPLARIAPTSLVFGAWDSRETSAKLPRLVSSTIRAFDVRKLSRSAQYVPALDYVGSKVLDEAIDKTTSDAYAERGFKHVPATGSPGGVIATSGVRRDASLHLAALRLLAAGDAEATLALRRYVLGLALVAFTQPPSGYLRQGCNLVLDPKKPTERKIVYGDGRREDFSVSHQDVTAFAAVAAKAFGIDPNRKIDFKSPPDREVPFDTQRAKQDVSGAGEGGKKAQKLGSRKAK